MSQEDSDLDISLVIGSLVHDMKNSLSMMLGTLDQVLDDQGLSKSPALQDLNQVRYEGNRVNHHLIQLLSLYRINRDQYSLNISDNDVHENLEECVLEYRNLLASKNIDLQFECDEDLLWYFDRNLIVGILNSVLNNAYKYAKSIIRLSAAVENEFLVISVADDGNGYPESHINENDPLANDINFKTSSTGLGIYFASKIASMHKRKDRSGYITNDNEGISGGGKFSIYLP